MSRRVRHIYASSDEHIRVHRSSSSSSDSGVSLIVVFILALIFLGSC